MKEYAKLNIYGFNLSMGKTELTQQRRDTLIIYLKKIFKTFFYACIENYKFFIPISYIIVSLLYYLYTKYLKRIFLFKIM
jgi:hypothetical protein